MESQGKDSESLGLDPPGPNQRPLSHGSKRLANSGRSEPPSPDRRTLESLGIDPLGSDPRLMGLWKVTQYHRIKRLAKDWYPPLPLPNIHQSLPGVGIGGGIGGVSIFDPPLSAGSRKWAYPSQTAPAPSAPPPSSQKTKDTFRVGLFPPPPARLAKPLDFSRKSSGPSRRVARFCWKFMHSKRSVPAPL